MQQSEAKLNEVTKDEWREVARRAVPKLTDEEFDQMWTDFIRERWRKGMQ